jgi:uracil-DNA glycosylase family protein
VTTPLDELRAHAASCKDCDLWEPATQTVFGEGPAGAPLMLMGEQPGDQEDKQGRPFVGPAGRILDDALEEAGIDRSLVYVTNAVKHFKFTPTRGGEVRLHKKPNQGEITACKQWWERELDAIQPDVLGLLGATAAQAVLGPKFRVTKERGQWIGLSQGVAALATIHPSAVLRAQERRDEEFAGLVADLRIIANRLESS